MLLRSIFLESMVMPVVVLFFSMRSDIVIRIVVEFRFDLLAVRSRKKHFGFQIVVAAVTMSLE